MAAPVGPKKVHRYTVEFEIQAVRLSPVSSGVRCLCMRLAIATVLFCVCGAFTGTALAENKWVRVKGGSWEPSATVLADMKKGLEPYVRNQAKLQARQLRKWREYTFQYQGGEEKGRKYVFINALCRPDAGWKLEEDFYMVRDGGSCYFHLKYDPTRRQFAELTINGEA